MLYALGGAWLSTLLTLALGLGPYAVVLWWLAGVAPPSARQGLAWAARAGLLGCMVILALGAAGTASSLQAMSAAATLVDARTARALWAAGALGACLPAAVGLGLGGGIALTFTRTLDLLAGADARRLLGER